MEVKSADYRVVADEGANTVSLEGTLRLNGADEYQPIQQLLDEVLARASGDECCWDLRELQFLNSSGINMLYQLVIKARRMGDVRMRVIGSKEVAWQSKSLANMTRFMPGLELVLEESCRWIHRSICRRPIGLNWSGCCRACPSAAPGCRRWPPTFRGWSIWRND